MSQRFEGRNLEEALTLATQTLGAERHQLTYHVLLEKRGFLGGMKRVVIEAELNPQAPAPAPPPPPVTSATPFADGNVAPAAPRSARPPRERGGRGSYARTGGKGGGGGASRDRGRRRRPPMDDDEPLQSGDFEKFFVDVPAQGAESGDAKNVREWIEKALGLAKLDLQARTEENETQIVVKLYGADTKRLIDRHGELLDAVQVLANKSLGGRKIEKDIELDAEGFKEHRIEDLGQRARDLADKVRRDGREQLLPAMSPIERRIVHVALQDDPDVTTDSRGDGFFKRVAIVPRPEAEASTES
jgi:spoIIIJ-associated protein